MLTLLQHRSQDGIRRLIAARHGIHWIIFSAKQKRYVCPKGLVIIDKQD